VNIGDVVEHKADGRRMVVVGFATTGFWRPRTNVERVTCEFALPSPRTYNHGNVSSYWTSTGAYERQTFEASALRPLTFAEASVTYITREDG
jgi:uncharacterized protein YodC (DUF2158 family)